MDDVVVDCLTLVSGVMVSHVYVWILDLAPAFNWNIKQLFVFLVAEYKSKKNVSPSFSALWVAKFAARIRFD